MMVLDMSARLEADLAVRYACLCHDLGKGTTPEHILPRHIGHEERSARLLKGMSERLRAPVDCRELADVVAREHGNIHRSGDLKAAPTLRLLERCDAIRKPRRFSQVLLSCECDARGRLGKDDEPYPQAARLQAALDIALGVDTAKVAAKCMATGKQGPAVGKAIQDARVTAIEIAWAKSRAEGKR